MGLTKMRLKKDTTGNNTMNSFSLQDSSLTKTLQNKE